MNKAFDNLLQILVSANDAAMNRGFEPYRFECPFCGEEVRIAAPDSVSVTPHFRHLHGNNSIECEQYFGAGIGSTVRNRSGYRECVDILYSKRTSTFMLRIKFTEDEITHYEEMESHVELKTAASRDAFKTIRINRQNFAPDVAETITLDKYSDKYYVYITGSKIRDYSFLSYDEVAFFKILGHDEQYIAKQVKKMDREGMLYTNTDYLAVSLVPNYIKDISSTKGVNLTDKYTVETMGGKTFYCAEISFANNNQELIQMAKFYGFRIEADEKLIVLWPPCSVIEDKYYTDSNSVYIKSSYDILPYSGNNLDAGQIVTSDDNVTELTISKPIKICRKNTELIIEKKEIDENVAKQITVQIIRQDIYVGTENICVVIDEKGTDCLMKGQAIHLINGRIIIEIHNGVPIKMIIPCERNKCSIEQRIDEIEQYYHFKTDDFRGLNEKQLMALRPYVHDGLVNNSILRMVREGKV